MSHAAVRGVGALHAAAVAVVACDFPQAQHLLAELQRSITQQLFALRHLYAPLLHVTGLYALATGCPSQALLHFKAAVEVMSY